MDINKLKKDLLEILSSRSQHFCNIITTVDMSTLYTIIPIAQLKSRIKQFSQCCFSKENGVKCISILLLVEIVHTLSKATQNLIIDINRSRLLQFLSNSKIRFIIYIYEQHNIMRSH